MPLTLVDYERLAKRSRGQAHVLMLEVLNRRTLLTGFCIFVFVILMYLGEVFYDYYITWQCQTVCGQPVSLASVDVNVSAINDTCKISTPLNLILAILGVNTSNPNVPSLFSAGGSETVYWFLGRNHSITTLNRFIQYQFLFQHPLPWATEGFMVRFDTYYELVTPVGSQGVTNQVLQTFCVPNQVNCNPVLVTVIDSPWAGNYSMTLVYRAMTAELANGTIMSAGAYGIPADNGATVMMCNQREWRTVLTLAVRYLGTAVLLAFGTLMIYYGHWPKWGHWIPEQGWSIGLLFAMLLYLNPLYGALLFVPGPNVWGFAFLQVMEYQVRLVGPLLFMAFEIVVVSSCQGIQAFLFDSVYCPTFFALLWALACFFFYCLNGAFNGFASVLGVPSVVDLPPWSVTTTLLCSWGVLVLDAAWYVSFWQLCLVARSELRSQPYLGTRCRQLTLRLVILWWVPKEIVYLALLMYDMTNAATFKSTLKSEPFTLTSELVLMLLNAISVVVMFMPAPPRNAPGLWAPFVKRGTEGDFLLYEGEAEADHGADRGLLPRPSLLPDALADAMEWGRELNAQVFRLYGDKFCVETAMIMYNLAFEVYMEPPVGFRPIGDVQAASFRAATAAIPRLKITEAMNRYQYLLHCAHAPPPAPDGPHTTSLPPSSPDPWEWQIPAPEGDWPLASLYDDDIGTLSFEPHRQAAHGPHFDFFQPTPGLVTFRGSSAPAIADGFAFEARPPARSDQVLPHPYTRLPTSSRPPRGAPSWQPSLGATPATLRTPWPPAPVPPPEPNHSPPQSSELPRSLDMPPNTEVGSLPTKAPSSFPLSSGSVVHFADHAQAAPRQRIADYPDTYDIQRLEAVLRAKKKKKVQRVLNQMNMSVERYGYRLVGVVSRQANQAMVVCGADHVGVSFRGTANVDNIRTDLNFLKTPYTEMIEETQKQRGCCGRWLLLPLVHGGFHSAWSALKDETLKKVAEAVADCAAKKFYISGHSLGGAIATLAAYEISRLYPDHAVIIYTFGSPRVGNVVFCRLFDKEVPCMWRIENERDVVPTVPPSSALYRHVGKTVRVDGDGLIILQPSYLESFHYTQSDRVASHMLSRYRKSLEAICHDFGMALREEVVPYGPLWEADA